MGFCVIVSRKQQGRGKKRTDFLNNADELSNEFHGNEILLRMLK